MSFKGFLAGRTQRQVAKQVEKELGNKSLSFISRSLCGLILIAGADKVRLKVIKGIEDDLERALKKNPQANTVDLLMQEKIVQEALHTPDYMDLLKELNMDESHIRVLAQEALKKGGDK